jgi:hypothetical protein
MVKGRMLDFFPNHPTFRVKTTAGDQIQVKMRELKAVFFVKDLDGNTLHRRRGDFPAIRPPGAEEEKAAILFKDGEVLLGYLDLQPPNRQGFFLVPADVGGNNVRVYVLKEATNYISTGSQAERLSKPSPQRGRASKQTSWSHPV